MSETASSPTILLVDDEAPITATLAPYLERNGFAVLVAGDGEEALTVLRGRAVDIIVSDVLMPRRDGRSLVRELRAREDWTPVILLTKVDESFERWGKPHPTPRNFSVFSGPKSGSSVAAMPR